ncbi:MAG: hypothetical protein ABI683_14050 [Ginsengibacter sp.]
MWFWWILSLIILIACIIFAYKMIMTSYEFLPADKKFFFRFNRNQSSSSDFADSPDSLKILRNKVKHVEDNTTFYHIQFSKFQDRLKVIEDKVAINALKGGGAVTATAAYEDEEDWKELYYQENAKKEQLENELDFAKQALEAAENKLNEMEGSKDRSTRLQSDFELRMKDLQSLQGDTLRLQKQLEASLEREKELEQLLMSEITMREKYSILQKEYTQLLSEADDLRRRTKEKRR